jgi:hypothetical protein
VADRVSAFLRRLLADRSGEEGRLRRGFAVLIVLFASALTVQGAFHGDAFSPAALLLVLLALAVWVNPGGRFVRDWGLVFLAFATYVVAGSAVPDLGLAPHYTPQIDAERLIGFGSLPTNWLQSHLYHGETGPLEVFSILMYMSHFLAPILLASLIWLYWPGRGFHDLFFGLLIVSVLADITFVLAPTAPPWLAAQNGYIPDVHDIIRRGLYDIGLDGLATRKNDADSYNIVAAVPSLHAAWPIIGLLVIRKHGLPRWVFSLQAALVTGVIFAIVYTGEHYFVDALVGGVYALAAWWILQRVLQAGPATAHRLQVARVRPAAEQLPIAEHERGQL